MNEFIYKKKGKLKRYIRNRRFEYKEWKDYKWLMGIVLVVLVALGLFYFFEPVIEGNLISGFNFVSSNDYGKEFGEVTFENLPEFLIKSGVVRDLPKDALILLVIGNHSYAIERNSVEEKEIDGADIIIYLPSVYLESIGTEGLCPTVKKANEAGDITSEIKLSEFELAWKYKSMVKYRECLL